MSQPSEYSSDECLSPIIPIKRRKFTRDTSISVSCNPSNFLLNTNDASQHHTDKFCRSSYIKSILQREGSDDVLAVIMSTFSLHLPTILLDFPDLCASHARIPTFIFHGHRRKDLSCALAEDSMQLSPLLTLCEVCPQHQQHSYLGVESEVQHIMGVHHPKYIIVLCRMGVYIAISTANLTPPGTSDMTWCSYFPTRSDNFLKSTIYNDFGEQLQEFLLEQSAQSAERSTTLEKWLHHHAHFDLQRFSSAFDFSAAAKAHLISTIPGRVPLPPDLNGRCTSASQQDLSRATTRKGMPCVTCVKEALKLKRGGKMGELMCCGGMLRVREVLKQCSSQLPRELDERDGVILQPTSIGLGMTNDYMNKLLCCYMPETLWDENTDTPNQEENKHRQDTAKIMWPTVKYVTDAASECGSSMLFMRQDILDAMSPDVQAQLHQYRSTLLKPLVPHQKCYLRLLSMDNQSNCSCVPLAWCLLSSACLSKGAQGDIHWPVTCSTCGHERQGYVEYKNFELGILLHSQYGDETDSVKYRAWNPNCPVHTAAIAKDAHVIPLPFDVMSASSYCVNGEFVEALYLNNSEEKEKLNNDSMNCESEDSQDTVMTDDTAFEEVTKPFVVISKLDNTFASDGCDTSASFLCNGIL